MPDSLRCRTLLEVTRPILHKNRRNVLSRLRYHLHRVRSHGAVYPDLISTRPHILKVIEAVRPGCRLIWCRSVITLGEHLHQCMRPWNRRTCTNLNLDLASQRRCGALGRNCQGQYHERPDRKSVRLQAVRNPMQTSYCVRHFVAAGPGYRPALPNSSVSAGDDGE
jgi:hypothetical protein